MTPDPRGEHDAMRKSTRKLLLLAVFALVAAAPAFGQDSSPIEVLKSDASYQEKEEACRQLQRTGGKEAIPVLAQMLTDKKFSHMARYALQSMPYPEVDEVLRDALGKTSGEPRVGIIQSLATRRDKKAVPLLLKVLSDDTGKPAQAAARALGTLATPEAVEALNDALGRSNLSADMKESLCEGHLRAAEALAEQGQADAADAIYRRLLDVDGVPHSVHTGALRGAVLVRGEDALPMVIDALHDEKEDMFNAAVRVSMELGEGHDVAEALADELSKLPPERQIPLMNALGRRGDAAAGPALLEVTENASGKVQAAGVRTLTRIGYSPALDLISELSWSAEGEVAEVARDCLAYFPGKARADAIKSLLGHKNAEARRMAVELIGEGALDEPVGVLMDVAQSAENKEVRAAALKAVGRFAGADEVPDLVDILLKARDEAVIRAGENALSVLCARLQKLATGGVKVRKAVYGVLQDGPSADVTNKVAKMVESGELEVRASNGNFGDPAQGERKKLRVEYTVNGQPISKTVNENETLTLSVPSIPRGIAEKLVTGLQRAEGPSKLAMLRVLRAAGGPHALETVRKVASEASGDVRETALRVLCDWPTPAALPAVMELVKNPPNARLKSLALRGAVRLLKESDTGAEDLVKQYSVLMDEAGSSANKKMVLSGLGDVLHPDALDLALCQMDDDSVRAEATLSAVSIGENLGQNARQEKRFFNGKNLKNWQGDMKYWSVEDGALVGRNEEPLDHTIYLWAPTTVSDFYLKFSVKLEPNSGNSGLQFRSEKKQGGAAFGHQADIGANAWGRIYHQGGRGKLCWPARAEKPVKPGKWNTYEVLAVGPAIWTSINGKLGVACVDEEGARSGLIAIQLHQGPPETVSYRFEKLIHNPPVKLDSFNTKKLIRALEVPQ